MNNTQTHTHWKRLYNPNYFGCWCMEDGKDMVLTIDHVVQESVSDEKGKQEMCMVVHFKENVKPLICNKTNAKSIEKQAESAYIEDWAGVQLQFYADHNVRFGRDRVDGVRIRPKVTVPPAAAEPVPPSEPELICTECGQLIVGVAANGKEYPAAKVAAAAQKKCGKLLCWDCALREAASAPKEENEDETL